MIKTLAKCIGKYKKESIITPIFTAVEVFLEILIPFITASIIDKGIQAGRYEKGRYLRWNNACYSIFESFLWYTGRKVCGGGI